MKGCVIQANGGENVQDFANVCLGRSTAARRTEDMPSDFKRQLEAKGEEFVFFFFFFVSLRRKARMRTRRRYAENISSLNEEFQQRFRDFAGIEKEIRLFFFLPLFPRILVMLQTTRNWSSLSCTVTWSVTITTNNSLSRDFLPGSWTKAGSKRFGHLRRKC